MAATERKNKYFTILIWILLVGFMLVRYAEPMKDGDVFWHIKYGEYHIQNKTLLADHSLFSWTPAIKHAPYCTWAADILFYLFFKTGGWPLLYVFMYLCLFSTIFFAWRFAKKAGVSSNTVNFMILIMVLLTIENASFVKPEIISLVFFVLVALLYFNLKIGRIDEKNIWLLFSYPLIFLLWANMHGVFLIGLVLLALMIGGELSNYFLKGKNHFSKRKLAVFTLSGFLSLIAIFITPYGIHLIEHILGFSSKGGMSQNIIANTIAFQPLTQHIEMAWIEHKLEFWGIMVISFVFLFFANYKKNKDFDLGILLPTFLLAAISLRYIRASFYWSPFWGMSIYYLASKERIDLIPVINNTKPTIKYLLVSLLLGISIFFPMRTMYTQLYNPGRFNFIGFGFNTGMPVQESAFLKEHKIGKKLFNSYNAGSYLIYDLYPDRKVFIDNRFFPYKDILYAKYNDFRDGRISLRELEREYGFDIAVITNYETVLNHFLASSRWKPIFYGVGGVVLAKDHTQIENDIRLLDKKRFDEIRNLEQAATIVRTAQNLNDLDAADYIISIMYKKFKNFRSEKRFEFFYSYSTLSQKGLRAYENKDYNTAFECLWKVGFNDSNIKTNQILKSLIYMKIQTYLIQNKYSEASKLMGRLLNYYGSNDDVMYNSGVIAYRASKFYANFSNNIKNPDWRRIFMKFIERYPSHSKVDVAKRLLANEPIENLSLLLNSEVGSD